MPSLREIVLGFWKRKSRPVKCRVYITNQRTINNLKSSHHSFPETSQADESSELVLNLVQHEQAIEMWKPDEFKNSPYMGPIAKARLSPEAREWCEINTPGFSEHDHPAANIVMRVVFKNDVDAILFKLKWL